MEGDLDVQGDLRLEVGGDVAVDGGLVIWTVETVEDAALPNTQVEAGVENPLDTVKVPAQVADTGGLEQGAGVAEGVLG